MDSFTHLKLGRSTETQPQVGANLNYLSLRFKACQHFRLNQLFNPSSAGNVLART